MPPSAGSCPEPDVRLLRPGPSPTWGRGDRHGACRFARSALGGLGSRWHVPPSRPQSRQGHEVPQHRHATHQRDDSWRGRRVGAPRPRITRSEDIPICQRGTPDHAAGSEAAEPPMRGRQPPSRQGADLPGCTSTRAASALERSTLPCIRRDSGRDLEAMQPLHRDASARR